MIKFLCDKVKLEQLKCHEIKPLKPCDLYDMKVEMNKLKESDPIVSYCFIEQYIKLLS